MSEKLLLIPVGIIVAILVFFLIVGLFQYLWNITMPQVFGLREITFWQGFRLLLLSALLFGWVHANK